MTTRIWIVAAIAAVATTTAGAAPMAGGDACFAIRTALTRLSDAEHQEAFALDLYAKGSALPSVEVGLTNMTDKMENLRTTLASVQPDGDPSAAACVAMGQRAMAQAQRLTSVVEGVVIKGRGLPAGPSPAGQPDGSASVQGDGPPAASGGAGK